LETDMNRPIVLAAVLVAVVVLGYLAMMALTGPGAGGRDLETTTAAPVQGEEVAVENTSTLDASGEASDEAFESALEGEEPVQSNLDTSRDLAAEAGAVGAAAFTPAGYDRVTVVNAIEQSDLEEAEKDELMDRLAAAEPVEGDLEVALAEIRERLALAE
jgi:hypothetical protein